MDSDHRLLLKCTKPLLQSRNWIEIQMESAVSHIPQFGDAASSTGDVDVSAGDAHL